MHALLRSPIGRVGVESGRWCPMRRRCTTFSHRNVTLSWHAVDCSNSLGALQTTLNKDGGVGVWTRRIGGPSIYPSNIHTFDLDLIWVLSSLVRPVRSRRRWPAGPLRSAQRKGLLNLKWTLSVSFQNERSRWKRYSTERHATITTIFFTRATIYCGSF